MNAPAHRERSARHALRDVGASLLWALGATRPARSAQGALVIVTFHRVLPPEDLAAAPLPGLCVTPLFLDGALAFFARHGALGLGGNAALVGPLAGAALTAEYAAADVFVLSSRMEGLPVVLMEAFAQGVPCIAPAVGGIAELVADANGWLFPAGDRAALASRLLAAGRERASLAARGAAGRAAVLAAHDLHKNSEMLRALLAPRLAD
jgi:glycosyltransferase involved in cell wall biosynthesis